MLRYKYKERWYSKMTFNEFANKIANIGGVAYFFCGCVPGEIMNNTPPDIYIVVCGITVDKFNSVFTAKQTGNAFPVFRLDIENQEIEVAFARIERKVSEGHNGFVMEFSPNVTIEEDLIRRDVTMNAIAKNILTGEILDPFNGIEDIRNYIIRATSNHFVEDALRVLRVARFAAKYNFIVDDNTIELMASCREELKHISFERVIIELKKALATDKPSVFFNVLKKANCLDVVFPEIYHLIGKTQPEKFHPEGDAYNHSMIVLDTVANNTKDIYVRFAALFHDIGKGLTPKEELPKHYGHDVKGAKLIGNLPPQYETKMKLLASFVAAIHMKIHTMKKANKIVDMLKIMRHKKISVDDVTVILLADHGSVPVWFTQDTINTVFAKITVPENTKNIPDFVRNEYIRRLKQIW